jgi:hypothetical protein
MLVHHGYLAHLPGVSVSNNNCRVSRPDPPQTGETCSHCERNHCAISLGSNRTQVAMRKRRDPASLRQLVDRQLRHAKELRDILRGRHVVGLLDLICDRHTSLQTEHLVLSAGSTRDTVECCRLSVFKARNGAVSSVIATGLILHA